MLGKPSGGARTICKTPTLYRVANLVTNRVQQWESHVSPSCPFDKAKKRSSALDAAFNRGLEAEVAFWLGQHFCSALNDFHKFFDTIDISVLLHEACSSEYPPVELCMALQQHLAPRVIQVCSFSSAQVTVINSILAGCKQSIPMTRTLLKNLMTKLYKSHPKAPPSVYVDDTTMSARHPKWSTVERRIVTCILDFAEGTKEIGLTLSDKATIVASHPTLAKRIQSELAAHGVIFQLTKRQEGARDLGITNTAGKYRPYKLLGNRINNSGRRINKIKSLAKLTRRSKILSSSSSMGTIWL